VTDIVLSNDGFKKYAITNDNGLYDFNDLFKYLAYTRTPSIEVTKTSGTIDINTSSSGVQDSIERAQFNNILQWASDNYKLLSP
jgi:hypothetical protein